MNPPLIGLLTLILFSFTILILAQDNSTVLPVGSCTPDIPCSNGACCNGKSGFCGQVYINRPPDNRFIRVLALDRAFVAQTVPRAVMR
jgi:hypothetical protein